MDLLDPRLLVEVTIAAAGFAVWFALLGVALLVTRPREVRPATAARRAWWSAGR
jgi:hypothetical protein